MPYKGEFKTAYLQREIPVDAAVMQGDGLVVGNLVKLVKAGANTVPYIVAATGNDKNAALADATHIIAQSDMTLEYGHVPVEVQDYRYKKTVACTVVPGTAGKAFLGVAANTAGLDTAFGTIAKVGDAAYVTADGKVYKCKTVKSGGTASTWEVDTAAVVGIKKVALFALIDKDDVIVKA